MTPTLSVDCLAQVSFHNNKQLTYAHSIIFPSLINITSWQGTITVTALTRHLPIFHCNKSAVIKIQLSSLSFQTINKKITIHQVTQHWKDCFCLPFFTSSIYLPYTLWCFWDKQDLQSYKDDYYLPFSSYCFFCTCLAEASLFIWGLFLIILNTYLKTSFTIIFMQKHPVYITTSESLWYSKILKIASHHPIQRASIYY